MRSVRLPSASRSSAVTDPDAAFCRSPVSSVSYRKRTPAVRARSSSTRSTSYCGVISTKGKRVRSRVRSSESSPKKRREVSVVPVLISSSARPRLSSSSSVRACTAKARVMLLVLCGRRSTSVTETPWAARSPASSRPVGPAPTTRTPTVSGAVLGVVVMSASWARSSAACCLLPAACRLVLVVCCRLSTVLRCHPCAITRHHTSSRANACWSTLVGNGRPGTAGMSTLVGLHLLA